MSELFIKFVNMSISASLLILVVMILRLVLKKAPKWVTVLLWGMVAFRAICPFSFESALSLIPSTETISQSVLTDCTSVTWNGSSALLTEVNSSADNSAMTNTTIDNSVLDTVRRPVSDVGTSQLQNWIPVFAGIWLFGVAALLAYTLVSYYRLHHKVAIAVLYKENIYMSEYIGSPFVFGLLKPRIYLPFNMDDRNLEHVIAHEQAHIRRRDHFWKPLGFVLLTLHWFNPLMWLAYVLLCRDIELACDEKVIKEFDNEQRADYTQALVACSVNRRMIAACPLAFGEVSVTERVKSVLHYKKPTFWIMVSAVIACVVIAFCFLTNPIAKNTHVMGANYEIEKTLYTVGSQVSVEPPLQYCVTADYHLYYQQTEGESWEYMGALTPYKLTNEELNRYLLVEEQRKEVKLSQITDAYILKVENDYFYLVFQTKSGQTYLAYGWEDVGERGQYGSDDTEIRGLYLMDSSFYSGYVNVNFFERSLINTVGNPVYSFAHYENDKIPGYHIMGFKSGRSENHPEMTNLGFAVFQTTGEGYRLIDYKVYENAVFVENGIYFCEDAAVADINGEMRDDNTFDVVMILNDTVDRMERVYHKEGKEDWVQTENYIKAPAMILWSWEKEKGYTSASQYFYDSNGNQIEASGVIP